MDLREECDGRISQLITHHRLDGRFAFLEARNHETAMPTRTNALLKHWININRSLCPFVRGFSTKLRAATDDDVEKMLQIPIFTAQTVVQEVSLLTLP
jgi:hypothetical protein